MYRFYNKVCSYFFTSQKSYTAAVRGRPRAIECIIRRQLRAAWLPYTDSIYV